MEAPEGREGTSPLFWFALGYLVASLVEIFMEEISRLFSIETIEPGTVVAFSDNGATGEKGETVSSLVKEESTSE